LPRRGNQQIAPNLLFDSIPSPEHAQGNGIKKKNSLITGRNLWQNQTQEGRSSVLTGWVLRGQERGDSKLLNTRAGLPAEKEKQK